MKKKIFLLTAFVLVLLGGIYSIGYKEVDAAEQCTTYTNYYLLLDATNINTIRNNFINEGDPYDRNTSKYFNLGISREAKNEVKKVIEVNASSTDTNNSWSLETFYNKFKEIGDNVGVPDTSNPNVNYIRATVWYNENGQETGSFTNLPSSSIEFRAHVPVQLRTPTIQDTCDADDCNLRISRTYNSNDVTNITEGTVFSPAVYMIQYQLCQQVADEPTYNVTVNFIDKANNSLLPNSGMTLQAGLKNGQNFNGYTCLNNISGYTLSTEDTSVHAGGVINNSNVELKCYYVKNEENAPTYKTIANFIEKATGNKIVDSDIIQDSLTNGSSFNPYTCKKISGYSLSVGDTSDFAGGVIQNSNVNFDCFYVKDKPKQEYTLTINFGTNNDCSQGNDIRKPENAIYTEGTTINYEIPTIANYEFSNVGSVTPIFKPATADGKLTFAMPSKNASICLVYIENKQTGAGWIYFAWIIGISALAYSGWYFAKYYKNQNTEV